MTRRAAEKTMQGRADGKHSDVIQQAEGERGWKPHVIALERRAAYSPIFCFFLTAIRFDAAHAQAWPKDALQGVRRVLFSISKMQVMSWSPTDPLTSPSGPPEGLCTLSFAQSECIDPAFLTEGRVTGPTCRTTQCTIAWKRLWRQLKFIVRLINP